MDLALVEKALKEGCGNFSPAHSTLATEEDEDTSSSSGEEIHFNEWAN